MRLKLIALFSLIVLVVGGLSYALSRVAVRPLTEADQAESRRALGAAVAQIQVEGLATERWLAAKAAEPAAREPFGVTTPEARGEAATAMADKISEAATTAPELLGVRPSQILLVDEKGVVLGRNRSKQGRNEDLGAAYTSLKASLTTGTQMSDVWVSQARDEQLLASYAPIRGADGKILGALVFASSLNDERLSAASDKTSGHALAVAVKGEQGLTIVAKSAMASGLAESLGKSPAADQALQTLSSGKTLELSGLPEGHNGIARVLDGYGDGRRAVVIAVVTPSATNVGIALLWPVAVAVFFGLILVVVGAVMFDAYLSRPLAEIEDGLLAIMNGQTNRRLDIEHAEFGGLVFRINSLLNQLFGVAEDDTDEEGRPSRAPTAGHLTEALSVDESIAMSGGGSADAAALFAEPEGAYYGRVFAEYVEAKRSIGDPTDHITQADFTERLRGSEQELAQKHGKRVRFKVEAKGKEVVLIAVPQG